MHIAIIGAGAAGLAAARHITDPKNGFTCSLFEQAGELGGTWVYTEKTGKDENGFPIHSSMYQGLRTNLPKEVMGFPDFAIPEQEKSYLKQEEILSFLNLYADNFNIRKNIKKLGNTPFLTEMTISWVEIVYYIRGGICFITAKGCNEIPTEFHRHVKEIRPLPKNRWVVHTIDVQTLEDFFEEFDALMVCNGHYNEPVYPNVRGQENFKGIQCHSHDYRKPDPFSGQNVLIIGAGPSGMDLALHISHTAQKVFLSHHSKDPINTKYPSNVIMKPDVDHLIENGANFKDGSYEDINIICYCTGYKYNFPFLHEECGITVDNNHIQPLYKHMVNIEKPTMCLIGIPFNVCAFQMFDLQVRYFLQSLNGKMSLPTKDQMYEETARDMAQRWKKGYNKRQAHMMGQDQGLYYQDLAESANIEPIAPVIVKLRDESAKRITEDLINFRNDIYKIIDNENYIKVN